MQKRVLCERSLRFAVSVIACLACLCATPLAALEAEDSPPVPAAEPQKPEKSEKKEGTESPDHTDDDRNADVVELPPINKPKPPAPRADDAPKAQIDTELDDVIIQERGKALKDKERAASKSPKPLENAAPKLVDTAPPKISEPGYATVLTGTLQGNTELHAEALPHLIRGVLIVPAKVTLKINAGAIVHLRSDPKAAKPLQAGSPDPTKSATVWVYGTLLVCGEGSKPVEFSGQDKDNAQFLFYGAEPSGIESARFKASDIAQNGGICQWHNCEFNDAKYYALASGAGQFAHCSFKKCGGIFAAYEEGPWALLVRRCLFENCRDGLLLNRDPGPACLLVDKNNFIGTRGANLRAMPRAGSTNAKNAEELLIGENWYGTTIEEEIDRRIVDRRADASIKAHLNTRPPAERPYPNAGAGASPAVISATLNEHQQASSKMLQALAAKLKPPEKAEKKVAVEKLPASKDSVRKDMK